MSTMQRDMLLRRALADQIAEWLTVEKGMATVVTNDNCPDCRAYLVMILRQGIPFCWECASAHEAAMQAKAASTKLRLAASGIEFCGDHTNFTSKGAL